MVEFISADADDAFLALWSRYSEPPVETRDALAYLVKQYTEDPDNPSMSIFDWYEAEIGRHFLKNFKQELSVVSFTGV